ncbi:hypothetical protein RHIZ404_20002 [Rhizobium sp. EC-SD404]|nr:hypothetical protein RHIZ404_20002 [Rhizobium sp. EC-SD404]
MHRLAALLGAAFARELAGKQLPPNDPSNRNPDNAQSSPKGQL